MSNDEGENGGFAERIEMSIRFRPLLEAAVEALSSGDIDRYMELLSPSLVAELGRDEIAQTVQDDLLPQFKDCVEVGGQTTIMRASDPYGHAGLAFYKFAVTEAGERRPFAIWIVEEDEKPVVAGVLPGARYGKASV